MSAAEMIAGLDDHTAALRMIATMMEVFERLEEIYGTDAAIRASLMISQYLMIVNGLTQADVSADCRKMRERWSREIARQGEDLTLVELMMEDLVR